jgi:hypothetical protein
MCARPGAASSASRSQGARLPAASRPHGLRHRCMRAARRWQRRMRAARTGATRAGARRTVGLACARPGQMARGAAGGRPQRRAEAAGTHGRPRSGLAMGGRRPTRRPAGRSTPADVRPGRAPAGCAGPREARGGPRRPRPGPRCGADGPIAASMRRCRRPLAAGGGQALPPSTPMKSAPRFRAGHTDITLFVVRCRLGRERRDLFLFREGDVPVCECAYEVRDEAAALA